MNDFFLKYYNTIALSVEILAAVVGLLYYKKYKLTTAKFFIWFLVYLAVCDVLGSYVNHVENGFLNFLNGTKLARNFWWSTLYWKIGAICFFTFFFAKILINRVLRKIIIAYGLFFLLFSILYILCNWNAYFMRFFPIISVLGAVQIFLCTVFYFLETLLSDSILTFYKSINFYVSAAIFIWWLIITPLIFYDIYHSYKDWNFIFLKWQIYLFANLLMYLTFTFAIPWCKPENEL